MRILLLEVILHLEVATVFLELMEAVRRWNNHKMSHTKTLNMLINLKDKSLVLSSREMTK